MMKYERRNCLCGIVFGVVMCLLSHSTLGMPRSSRQRMELTLEPSESIVFAGDNVTFTCSYPKNVTFEWNFNSDIRPDVVTNGVTVINDTGDTFFWSRVTLLSVKRHMSDEIICSIKNTPTNVAAFFVVNGVKIGGRCTGDEDCITDKATCQEGTCLCPKNDVLLRLPDSGYEVCRKMSYRLYDPCEFSEECFHLVDSKSVCAKNHVCVCASWAVDVNGKCVSKSELNYNKDQELFRVGLVAITCLIIIIVAISLWITLRKSCVQRIGESQRTYMNGNGELEQGGNSSPGAEDKPPSYDDALESTDTVSSPPNFKDALIHSMTAKRLLRQVSAPAGQLLSRSTSIDSSKKPNSDQTQPPKPKS